MGWTDVARSWGILVAAIGIVVGGCSSSEDPQPPPDPKPESTGTVKQPSIPSCAEQDARCEVVFPGSVSYLCHQEQMEQSQKIHPCAPNKSPVVVDDAWACCK